MTARHFLEYAGFEVTEHTLSRLTDYVQSNIDFVQFPDAEVTLEDGTPLNECGEEPARFQEWVEGGILHV